MVGHPPSEPEKNLKTRHCPPLGFRSESTRDPSDAFERGVMVGGSPRALLFGRRDIIINNSIVQFTLGKYEVVNVLTYT